MYAIAEIAGRQVQLSQGLKLRVPKLDLEAGAKLTVDRVLALVDGENSRFGAPVLDGMKIEATVLEHGLGRKVINFKMKRRKGYRRKHGHRQAYTLINVDSISA